MLSCFQCLVTHDLFFVLKLFMNEVEFVGYDDGLGFDWSTYLNCFGLKPAPSEGFNQVNIYLVIYLIHSKCFNCFVGPHNFE